MSLMVRFGAAFAVLAFVALASGDPIGNRTAIIGASCVADWGKCGGKEYDGKKFLYLFLSCRLRHGLDHVGMC